jgi:hypothetical protein
MPHRRVATPTPEPCSYSPAAQQAEIVILHGAAASVCGPLAGCVRITGSTRTRLKLTK